MIYFHEIERDVRAYLQTIPEHVTIPEVLEGIGLGNMIGSRGIHTNVGRALQRSGWRPVAQMKPPNRQRIYINMGS